MSTSNWANCDFCGDIVKKDLANTYKCPTCRRKPKTCESCGKTMPIYDIEKEKYNFAYNASKDTINFEDPFNSICQICQNARRDTKTTKDDEDANSLNLTELQVGIIEMVKAGMDNKTMAEKCKISPASLRTRKSQLKKSLEAAGMSFESYPNRF